MIICKRLKSRANGGCPGSRIKTLKGLLPSTRCIGGMITLEGSFQGCNLAEYEIVHGFADDKDITLRRYYERKIVPDHTDGSCQTVASVKQIFIGHHFETSKDISFDRLSLSSKHLSEWMRQPQIGFELDERQNDAFESTLRLTYLTTPNSYGSYIQYAVRRPRQDARIEIHAQTSLHFDRYQWYMSQFATELARRVATGKPSFPLDIRGETGESQDSCSLFTTRLTATMNPPRLVPQSSNMLFHDP